MARLAFIYFTPRHQRRAASAAREAAFSAALLSLPTMLKYFIPEPDGHRGCAIYPGNGTKAGYTENKREREREKDRDAGVLWLAARDYYKSMGNYGAARVLS